MIKWGVILPSVTLLWWLQTAATQTHKGKVILLYVQYIYIYIYISAVKNNALTQLIKLQV